MEEITRDGDKMKQACSITMYTEGQKTMLPHISVESAPILFPHYFSHVHCPLVNEEGPKKEMAIFTGMPVKDISMYNF